MKTAIKSIALSTIAALVLTGSSLCAFAADDKKETTLNEVKKVNSVKVSGNVELILVQSNAESVKVYDDYYAKNAVVQQRDGELRISSYEKETLTVVVFTNSLNTISASDRAKVKTYGKFNALSLDVKLENKATADLNMNAIDLTSDVADDSSLTLTGSAVNYNGLMGNFAKVNLAQFNAEETNLQSKENFQTRLSK